METKLTTAEETKTKKGPAPVLDAEKRRLILALISNGFSRRMAARYVRCAPSTITYTAEHNPDFADQLAAADNSVALEALTALRRATKQDRYWRAAAWLLERQLPSDFAPPSRDHMPNRTAILFFHGLMKKVFTRLPEQYLARMEENLLELHERLETYGIADAKDYLEHLPSFEDNSLHAEAFPEDLEDEDFADEDEEEDEASA